jgi:hypothetical protein
LSKTIKIEDSGLASFDTILVLLFATACLGIVFVFLPFVILGPILRTIEMAQFGFASAAIFDICSASVSIYQYEKCIQAVKKASFDPGHNSVQNGAPQQVTIDKKLADAIRRMREQQIIIFSIQMAAGVLWFLNAALVVPLTWWILALHISADILVVFFMLITHRRPSRDDQQASYTPKPIDGDKKVAVTADTPVLGKQEDVAVTPTSADVSDHAGEYQDQV